MNINLNLGNLGLGNLNTIVDNYYRQNPEAAASSGYTPPSRPIVAPAPVAPVAPKPTPVAPKPTPVAPQPTPVAPQPVVTPAPVAPAPPTSAREEYLNTLEQGADYNAINDVDEVDDFYDNAFQDSFLDPNVAFGLEIGGEGGGGSYMQPEQLHSFTQVSKDQYLAQGAPEYLATWDGRPAEDSGTTAYRQIAITDAESTREAVSNYYGYDVQASGKESNIADFGGNYREHTNASQEKISEFQSLIQPVMKEQVSYLQATEGLSYQDALVEAYNRDPMVQALYAKYDVTPFRQTKDGSTYLYDPFTFGEIRTKEVKDTGLQDGLKALAIMGLTMGAGSALGGFLATSTSLSAPVANAVGAAVASGTSTLAQGGDLGDIATSAILAGAGGYGKGLEQVAEATTAIASQTGSLTAQADQAWQAVDRFNNVVRNTEFAVNVAKGDYLGGIVGRYGRGVTEKALDSLGLDSATLKNSYGIQQNDMVEGLVKMQSSLAKGKSFEESLQKGFQKYLTEGGTLGLDIDTPEFIEKIGDVVKVAGSAFDDYVLQPIKEALPDSFVDVDIDLPSVNVPSAAALEDAIKAGGSATEDVVRAAASVVDQPIQRAGDVIAAGGQAVKEASEEVYENIPSVPTPEFEPFEGLGTDLNLNIDGPDLSSIDVDVPSVRFELPKLKGLEIGEVTDSLFGDYTKKYTEQELLQRRKFRGYAAPQGMFKV